MLKIRGASVNARFPDDTNDTLLHRAVRKNYLKIVKELLEYRADVNAKNEKGCTALMEASLKGHHEIIKELLIHHAEVNSQNVNGATSLITASSSGHYEIVKELLNHHAEVNSQDINGVTSLIAASSSGHYEIVKELLNHHAEVNSQNVNGATSLITASSSGHYEIVKLLLNHNADVTIQSKNGNTALHSALLETITDTTIKIVKLLLSDQANLEKVNKNKQSVMQLAKESQNQDLIDFMEDFSDLKKVEAAETVLKKLQSNQIVNKMKRKLLRVSTVNVEVLNLQQNINQMEMRIPELEEKLTKYRKEVKTSKHLLKRKLESKEFKSYQTLKENIDYFERCYEKEAFDKVIQPAKRECPICFEEMAPKKKIYHCQSGHFFCEDCLEQIRESTKTCPFCRVDIASVGRSIRCRALEEVIEIEAD